jgi:hypothetical protein
VRKVQKLKVAFGIFAGVAISGLVGGVAYLESERFGLSVKHMISNRSPQKLGVVGDFSNLKLYFFPPGIGIANPKLKVQRENITELPIEASIEATELRFSFAPIQMLSGTLQVSEVAVVGGAVEAKLGADFFKPSVKAKNSDRKFGWQDLFKLQVNGVRLEDTYLNVQAELPRSDGAEINTEFVVKHLEVKKDKVSGKDVILSNGLVTAVKVDLPKQILKLPIHEANQLQWNIELSDRGLKLAPLVADFSGTNVRLDGEIAGNLLDEKSDPSLNSKVVVVSDLSNFFVSNFNDSNWAGQGEVSAKIQAKIRDVEHSLKGSFDASGTNLSWKDIHVSKLSAQGEIDLAGQTLSLKKLLLSDESKSVHGSVLIENTNLSLAMDEPFSTALTLNQADVQWLGSAVLKKIFALDGRISGNVQAQFNPLAKNRWTLKAQTNLSVEQFALTNQRYGMARPKHYILKPLLPLHLSGGLDVSSQGVEFLSYKVKMNQTALDVSGGVSAKEGFHLRASGPIEMKEMDQIAENPVRGNGELKANVHGPSDAVLLDFDTQLKNAEYMNMIFGDMSGRVTYDDGSSEIRFTNINAKQKGTFYSLNDGFIDLSDADDVHLPFQIHSGRIEDIATILTPLVKKISWFPKTLQGEVHGKVDLAGKLDIAHMIISSDLEGSDWAWMGERARKVKMNVGYDQGTYFARNVVITKTNGDLKGDIDYVGKSEEMHWDFLTENLSLNDIDFIDRLEIPAKSKIEFQSKGSGKIDHLKSKTDGRLFGTELKGESFEPSLLNLEISENNLTANLNVFGKQLQSQLKYSMLPKQPSSFSATFNHFDFSPALLVLNPKLLDDPELRGSINGHIKLDFLSTQSEYARGEIKISEYQLKKTGFSLELVDPVDLPIQLGYFKLLPATLRFKNSELKVSGEGHKGDVDILVEGNADLAIAELFSSSIQHLRGKAATEIRLSGPLKEMKVNGDLTFNNAYGLMRFMQTPLEEMDGVIRLRQGQVYVENIEAYLGDEVFSMNGKIDTFADRFPKIDLRMQFDDNKIKMAPLDLVQVRGIASIKGEQPPYTIAGNLDVPKAVWTKNFGQSSGAVTRGARFAPIDRQKQLVSNLFNLDLNITANQNFFVRNDIMDGEFKGKVKLLGPPESPKLLGEGQLIQGRVLFRDRPFVFETAKIQFDDPYQIDPKFSISAISEVSQYKIKVLAFGRASSWKAEFSSTPFLAESEIYSLLASGLTTAETGRFKSRDRSYVNQGEAASLILHSLDFSKDVQSKTGFQFDVEEAVDNQAASSVFRPQSLSDNIAAPKLVIKRKLGRQFDLSFGSTVGVGNQSQKEVNAEYKLTSGMSVLGVWNNIEEVNVRDTRTSFGLDVKFNKKFK